jgi:NADP-dependent 3-hydroxy acid dehydrogenase YdfG
MNELLYFNKGDSKKYLAGLTQLPKLQKSPTIDEVNREGYFFSKVIIITGASSGIGRAMALHFSSKGARIVLAARNIGRLNEVAGIIKENGGKALIVPTDVTEHHDCYHLIDKTLEVYGTIDILINNAGISMRADFLDVDIDVLKRVMNTNFWGAVYCTRHALPHLIESKGSLVAISSICGITPLPGRTGYAASKHALDGFIDTIRVEQLQSQLHVLSVHAGFTASNIRNTALNRYGKEQKETPRNEEKMMSAEAVAQEVGKAIKSQKRDIVLTRDGILITWLYKRLPGLADKLIYNEMAKEDKSPF